MKTAEIILNEHLWMGTEPSSAQDSIIDAMEEYASQDKWISVKDGLPFRDKAVLVCLKSGLVTVAYRSLKDGKKIWQLFGPIQDIFDLKTESVTHWQPLPSAPGTEIINTLI